MDDISQYLNTIKGIYDPIDEYDVIYTELIYILSQLYKKKDINEYYITN